MRYDTAGAESGFSLPEAIIATGLLAGALVSLAQMFVIAASTNRSARAGSYAVVLAQQKLEELRGRTWGFDILGAPISDLTTGAIDYVDDAGNSLGEGTPSPARAMYVRRWITEPLSTNPNTIVIQVVVMRVAAQSATARFARSNDEVHLATLKTRTPR